MHHAMDALIPPGNGKRFFTESEEPSRTPDFMEILAHLATPRAGSPLAWDVRLADPVDHPVFIYPSGPVPAASYHMAVLPARLLGGEARNYLTVRFHDGSQVDVPYTDRNSSRRAMFLREAAEAGPLTLCGLGTVNVVVRGSATTVGPGTGLLLLLLIRAGVRVWTFPHLDPASVCDSPHELLAPLTSGTVVFTEHMANVMQQLVPTKPVAVMPPCLDPFDLPPSRTRRDDKVRVGFGGATAKYEGAMGTGSTDDLYAVLPVLEELAEGEDVELHFWGYDPPGGPGWYEFGPAFGTGAACFHGHVDDYRSYLKGSSQLDIAIAPLSTTSPSNAALNASRWQGHWLDHAIFATAVVATDLPCYDEFEDGVTILKARTEQEWRDALVSLVDDAKLRKRIGRAARELALKHYTADAGRKRWQAWYEKAVRREDKALPTVRP